MAHRHGSFFWRRIDYGFQRYLSIRRGMGGPGIEIRRLEQRVSVIGDFGDFWLHRIVFRGDDRIRYDGERTGRAPCGIYNAYL